MTYKGYNSGFKEGYAKAIQDALKVVPKKKERRCGDPECSTCFTDGDRSFNEAIDTITSELKKLKLGA